MATLLRPPVDAFILAAGLTVHLHGIKLEENGCVIDVLFARVETLNEAFVHDFIRSYSFKK